MYTSWLHNADSFHVVEDSPSTSGTPSDPEDVLIEPVKKLESPKICAICGDKASGLNYEVPSCYGCKSFFRRTLQNQKRFACSNEGECKAAISKAARLQCRACRFDRCVELGMNPLAVNAVKDKDSNKMVHEILRRQRQLSKSSPSSSFELLPLTSPVECKYDRLIDEMIYLEDAHQKLRRSQFNPHAHAPISVEWCLLGPSRMGIDFGDMPVFYPPLPLLHTYVPMQIRIRDRIPMGPKCEYPPEYKKWGMVDLIYTIEWLKTFEFFHRLEEKEKIQLVKNVTQMVSFLAAAFYSYEVKGSDVTIMPDGQILIDGDLPEEATIDRANNFEIIARLKSLQMDKKEYVLLKAIMACNPDHEVFSPESRRSLQNQRELFTKSLLSYVLARRGPTKGPLALTHMLSLITWQHKIARKHKDLYLLLNALNLAGAMPHLMLEVYS